MTEYWIGMLCLAAAHRQIHELDREDMSPYRFRLARFIVWGYAALPVNRDF